MKKSVIICVAILIAAFQVKAQVSVAIIHMQNGLLDKAKEAIDKSMQSEKDLTKSKTWFYRGEIYKGIAISQIESYANLDPKAALTAYESYNKVIELEANEKKKPFTEKAKAAYNSDELYVGALNEALRMYKDKTKDSYQLLEKAMTLRPADTTSLWYITEIAFELKDYDKFLESSQKLSNMKVVDSTQRTNALRTAYIYINIKEKPELAIPVLEKGLTFMPDDVSLIQPLAELYQSTNQEQKAYEAYKKAVKLEPENMSLNINYGFILYNKAVDIDKQKRDAGLGGNLKDKKAIEKAKEYDNKADEYLKEAIPYLEKGEKLLASDTENKKLRIEALDILLTCYDRLKMEEKAKITKQELEKLKA